MNRLQVAAGVEPIAHVQRLQILIAVQLLVIGVGDGGKACLVFRCQNGCGVATKVRSRHGQHVNLATAQQLFQLPAQYIRLVHAHMVELVYSDQSLVERVHAQRLQRETKGSVRTHQRLVFTLQELADSLHLALDGGAGLLTARHRAQVPARFHHPICPEAARSQRFVGKAAANGPLRHHDQRLLHAAARNPARQLVQRHVHQRTALAAGRRRLDQQELLAAHLVHALLHGPHPQLVYMRRAARVPGRNRHRWNLRTTHAWAFLDISISFSPATIFIPLILLSSKAIQMLKPLDSGVSVLFSYVY